MVTASCATPVPQPIEPYIAALKQLSTTETPVETACERPPIPSQEDVVGSQGGVLKGFTVAQEGALSKCEARLQGAATVVKARQAAEADLAQRLEMAAKSAQITVR